MIQMRASIVSLKDDITEEFLAELSASSLADSSALRPSMPKLRCLTDKKGGRESRGEAKELSETWPEKQTGYWTGKHGQGLD